MAATDWPAEPQASDFTVDTLEQMVLRGVVAFPSRRKAVFDLLDAGDFHHGRNRTLFEVLGDMHHDRSEFSFSTIIDELDRRGWLADVGGLSVLEVVRYVGYEGDPLLLANFLLDHVRKARLKATATEIAGAVGEQDFDAEDAAQRLIANARPSREYGIDQPADLREVVVDELRNGVERGVTSGFGNLDELYRVVPGLWTVVTGIPGSGKSTFVDGITVNLAAKNGWRFAMFSPESAPTSRHIRRLASMFNGEKLSGATEPVKRDRALEFVEAHYEWINSTEGVDVREILRRTEVIHRRTPIKGLVIDPWNEVDHARPANQREDEYLSQALTLIRRFARRHSLHVWVVAHPTKLQRDGEGYKTPTLYDISGGAQWRNKADMGLIVDRDFNTGVTRIHVPKVRFADHGQIGVRRLHYHPKFEGFADEPPRGWQEGAI